MRSSATAPAVVSVWVSETSALGAELARAGRRRAAQAHLRGAVGGHDLHVAEAPAAQAQRLGHRLLGAEARGEVLPGPGALGGVGALAVA